MGRCFARLPWILAPQLSGISGGADDGGTASKSSFRDQLIYRPIFQFEAAFVRGRAESSILFSFDTQLNRRVKASHVIELGRTVCG
jgi:hypothetical protein